MYNPLKTLEMEKLEKIEATVNALLEDGKKQFKDGNKAAGARARKAALELIADLKAFRKESLEAAKKK